MNEPAKRPDQRPEGYSPKGKPEILKLAQQARQKDAYPEEYILPDRGTPLTPGTKQSCPAYVAFANEFAYFLDYTGQGYGFVDNYRGIGLRCDISYTLADVITGYAARPCCLEVTPEGLDRLYEAAGFTGHRTYCANPSAAAYLSEAEMKEAIRYALCELGQPVILRPIENRFFGAIVIGYKAGGDVLVTYGSLPFFVAPDIREPQVEDITDWYRDETSLTIVGERGVSLPIVDMYKLGLRQIRDTLRAGIRGEDAHYYGEWERFLRLGSLEEMLSEAKRLGYVPGAQMWTEESLREDSIHVIADPTWCEASERRYYIMHFLYQAVEHFPGEKEALNALGDQFWKASEIMGNMKKGYLSKVGNNPVNMKKLAKKRVRAHMADCVRKFREADTKGLEMIEQLLAHMDMEPEGYSPKARPDILRIAGEGNMHAKGLAENVLQGIPRLRYGEPSAVCYIGCVKRLMEYLKDPVEDDELFALSGAGLCFPWQYKSCCDEISVMPEIPRRTFAALGYESEYYYEPDISGARQYSKAFYAEKIRRSIDSGRPVIGFGFTAEVFTCLITGYYDGGDGLYMRAFWSPSGSPEGYDEETYYRVDEWYDKCHGIVLVGEKTGERLAGEKAYAHIRETAAIFNSMDCLSSQGKMICTGFSAFDAMTAWLLDDSQWDKSQGKEELGRCEVFLKPCGVLLLQYYRDHLRLYLEKLSGQCPALVHPAIVPAVHRMAEIVSGKERSDWLLGKAVDRRLRKFPNMRRRGLREKVAARVAQLKEIDREIFDCLLETRGKTP